MKRGRSNQPQAAAYWAPQADGLRGRRQAATTGTRATRYTILEASDGMTSQTDLMDMDGVLVPEEQLVPGVTAHEPALEPAARRAAG